MAADGSALLRLPMKYAREDSLNMNYERRLMNPDVSEEGYVPLSVSRNSVAEWR